VAPDCSGGEWVYSPGYLLVTGDKSIGTLIGTSILWINYWIDCLFSIRSSPAWHRILYDYWARSRALLNALTIAYNALHWVAEPSWLADYSDQEPLSLMVERLRPSDYWVRAIGLEQSSISPSPIVLAESISWVTQYKSLSQRIRLGHLSWLEYSQADCISGSIRAQLCIGYMAQVDWQHQLVPISNNLKARTRRIDSQKSENPAILRLSCTLKPLTL